MRSNDTFDFMKRWPLCCLLFFLLACHSQKTNQSDANNLKDSLLKERSIDEAINQITRVKKTVLPGDLVVRTGKDFTSDAMRKLSQQDKTYSHCGIASWEEDTLFVYHALGGDFNPDQKIRRDPFEFFCNPYENKGFGIFRYQLNKQQQQGIVRIAKDYFLKGTRFDMQFDLTTDERMYCSEYIYKTIKKATSGSIPLHTTTLNKIQFVAIDNLFVNPYCSEIQRVVFNQNNSLLSK